MSDKKKKAEQDGILESSEVLAQELTKAEHFLESNKKIVFIVGGVLAAAILIFIGGKFYLNSQNQLAQRDMFQAEYYFQMDSLNLALNGDGNYYGFLDIIDEYAMTDAANLANFYAGACYLKQGEFESALDHLKKFGADDFLIQARAYALIGDAYMEMGDYGSAANYYNKAANYNSNIDFSPVYLQKAALASEKDGDVKSALENYEAIVSKYYGVAEYQEAKKHAARLKGML